MQFLHENAAMPKPSLADLRASLAAGEFRARTVLGRACAVVAEGFGFERVGIVRYVPATGVLIPFAAHGLTALRRCRSGGHGRSRSGRERGLRSDARSWPKAGAERPAHGGVRGYDARKRSMSAASRASCAAPAASPRTPRRSASLSGPISCAGGSAGKWSSAISSGQ